MYKYEILKGFPVDADDVVFFNFNNKRNRSEALVVCFSEKMLGSWVGNFEFGLSFYSEIILDATKLIAFIVSKGQGYFINLKTKELIKCYGFGTIIFLTPIPNTNQYLVLENASFSILSDQGDLQSFQLDNTDGLRLYKLESDLIYIQNYDYVCGYWCQLRILRDVFSSKWIIDNRGDVSEETPPQ